MSEKEIDELKDLLCLCLYLAFSESSRESYNSRYSPSESIGKCRWAKKVNGSKSTLRLGITDLAAKSKSVYPPHLRVRSSKLAWIVCLLTVYSRHPSGARRVVMCKRKGSLN
jgi:hypothetical protein